MIKISDEAVFLFETNKDSYLYLMERLYHIDEYSKLIIVPPNGDQYWYCMLEGTMYQGINTPTSLETNLIRFR